MQGFIFFEFKHFVEQKHGIATWDEILEQTDISCKSFNTFVNYPYEDLFKLINAVAKLEGSSQNLVMEEYGQFIIPKIWRISNCFIPKKWTLMDLLENVNHIFDRVMINAISGQRAPSFSSERRGDNQIVINYQSFRKMCPFGIGMVKGLGEMYNCNVSVVEATCMLRGDAQCEIIFNITKKAKSNQLGRNCLVK